jgi:hypothetical protein
MNGNLEKRVNDRKRFSAPIVFSYFNKEECFKAKTLNHCPGGVCFKSEVYLKPGADILFRAKDPSCNHCGGLRIISLAEVRWCREIRDSKVPSYEIGIKYYDPVY